MTLGFSSNLNLRRKALATFLQKAGTSKVFKELFLLCPRPTNNFKEMEYGMQITRQNLTQREN